jgi:hypothetical protein
MIYPLEKAAPVAVGICFAPDWDKDKPPGPLVNSVALFKTYSIPHNGMIPQKL